MFIGPCSSLRHTQVTDRSSQKHTQVAPFGTNEENACEFTQHQNTRIPTTETDITTYFPSSGPPVHSNVTIHVIPNPEPPELHHTQEPTTRAAMNGGISEHMLMVTAPNQP